MGKLIELLNEFEKENGRNFEVKEIGMTFRNNDLMVISKRYGFIQRLVENDKIDFSRGGDLAIELVNLFERKVDNADGVIALLSIQDNPIEFLISILK